MLKRHLSSGCHARAVKNNLVVTIEQLCAEVKMWASSEDRGDSPCKLAHISSRPPQIFDAIGLRQSVRALELYAQTNTIGTKDMACWTCEPACKSSAPF